MAAKVCLWMVAPECMCWNEMHLPHLPLSWVDMATSTSFFYAAPLPPPSTLTYINLFFVRAQKCSEVECIDISLENMLHDVSPLFSLSLVHLHISKVACGQHFPSAGELKASRNRKDTGSGLVKGTCLVCTGWLHIQHLHSLRTPLSECERV